MEEETKQLDSTPLIDKAQEIAARLEESEKRIDAKIKQNEDLLARIALSGRSVVGNVAAPIISEEDKLKQETKDFFKGTMIEKMIK